MSAMAEPVDQEDGTHRCISGPRCANKLDGKPRDTEKPDTFCDACLRRTRDRIHQLPEQWVRLHQGIGDRHAGVDVNIRRPKPGGAVPLNLHVDTLLGDILTHLTTAAEVVADKLNMADPTEPRQKQPVKAPPWAKSPKLTAADQVHRCVGVIAPNLTTLITATGVGGRDHDDRAIDVMTWTPNGLIHMESTTTGVQLAKKLDHLGSLAYFSLGLTRQRTQRDLPCSRCRARTVGRWSGADYYDCQSCGSHFPEEDLRRQDKILIELHKRGMIQPEAS